MTNTDIFGVKIPDSRIAREITQLIRDTESDVLFYHSTRVYFWGALTGKRNRLTQRPKWDLFGRGLPEVITREVMD